MSVLDTMQFHVWKELGFNRDLYLEAQQTLPHGGALELKVEVEHTVFYSFLVKPAVFAHLDPLFRTVVATISC